MTNETLQSIANRRSTRKYKPEQIKEAELQAVLQGGIQAPSAVNAQPWYFTVVQNKELIDHISEKAKEKMRESDLQKALDFGNSPVHLFYEAPTLIIVSGKEAVGQSIVDCAAAIENMLIAAESIGLGSVWVGRIRFFFLQEDGAKQLEIPEGYTPYYGVALGYKATEDLLLKAPKRRQDVVHYIR